MKKLWNSYSGKAVIILVSIIIIAQFANHYWTRKDKVITWDVLEYYQYLPATFIYGDVTLSFMNDSNRNDYWVFWPHVSPTGKWVFKFTMGMSILYSPFFFMAHLYALLFDEPTGYSSPYKFMLVMSSWVFLLIGLIYLRKILLRYFKEPEIILALTGIVLGTNLLYYTAVRSAMSHVYSFALFSVFIYQTIKWYEQISWKKSIILGLLAGLISLIRPSNTIILLFIFLYDIRNLKERVQFLLQNSWHILLMAIMFLLVWTPQMFYWKAVTGQWMYWSYDDEGFFFNNPQIIRGLFSYRNGWLLYTPIMAFGLGGIYFIFRDKNPLRWPVLLFTLLNIYIITSWWCWWYVGFGNRAFIESYAVLSLPLTALIARVLKSSRTVLIAATVIFGFLLYMNIFQVWQYKNGYIQPDSMTREAYWKMFLNKKSKDKFWHLIKRPDYEKAKKGIYNLKLEKKDEKK